MLLDLNYLVSKYDLKITGILHVGAHLAEEAPLYHLLGINNVWWIEGNADNLPKIHDVVDRYNHKVIGALITDRVGKKVLFHITNYESMSSSVLPFGTHPQFSPDTVFVEHREMSTSTLDEIKNAVIKPNKEFKNVNFLNMDLQGAELLALKGATELLPQIDYIYTEVNDQEVYRGCAKVWELDEFLSEFDRVETGWVDGQGWGDAFYRRNK